MTQVLRDTARRTAMKVVARPESHGLAVVHDDQSISVSAIYSEALRDCAMITQGSQCCFFINEYHSELHHSLHCTITSALITPSMENASSASSASASSSPYCRHEMKVPEIDNDCRRV